MSKRLIVIDVTLPHALAADKGPSGQARPSVPPLRRSATQQMPLFLLQVCESIHQRQD